MYAFRKMGKNKFFLTLVGRSGAVPEEDPLQALVALELVFEAEGVFLVGELEEVWSRGQISDSWEGGAVYFFHLHRSSAEVSITGNGGL